MTTERSRVGRYGEDIAAAFLKRQGYHILEKNFRVKVGEIDIIARDGDTICFVEVKARGSDSHGSGFEAISRFKRIKLTQTALWYLASRNIRDTMARFDVISIMMERDSTPRVKLLKNAFDSEED